MPNLDCLRTKRISQGKGVQEEREKLRAADAEGARQAPNTDANTRTW